MTFFFWVLLLFILTIAASQEQDELWWLRARLQWRRITGTGDGPTEWS